MIYVNIVCLSIMWMVLLFMSYWTMQIWSVSTEFGILCAIKTLVVYISCVYGTYIIYKDYKDTKNESLPN